MNERDDRKTKSQLVASNTDWPLMGRRAFFATAAATTTAIATRSLARDYGTDAPPARYPDPDVVVIDKRFAKYKVGTTSIRRLYHSQQMLWAEGPAWNGVGRYLVWSDIPNNVQLRWLAEDDVAITCDTGC